MVVADMGHQTWHSNSRDIGVARGVENTKSTTAVTGRYATLVHPSLSMLPLAARNPFIYSRHTHTRIHIHIYTDMASNQVLSGSSW